MGKKLNGNWKVVDGRAFPMGVTLQDDTLNFAVEVSNGEACELLLRKRVKEKQENQENLDEFGQTTEQEVFRISMIKLHVNSLIYSIALKNFDFQDYTYTYEANGKEFVDPYAKVIYGRENFGELETTEKKRQLLGGFPFDKFDWEEDKQLGIPYENLIMYQLHVRGFTKHSSSKVKQKGTYAGVLEKIPYLKELGVNALILLPIVEFDEIMNSNPYGEGKYNPQETISLNRYSSNNGISNDKREPNKINYWGYGCKSYYFAPKASYAADTKDPVTELKTLVKALHDNNMELILEMNFPKNMSHSMLQEVLRYWAMEYHVDGFRISGDNLPTTLIATDPMLRHIKLISDGFNLGEIYGQEEKPRYRNLAIKNENYLGDVRKFLKGDEEQAELFTHRFKQNSQTCATINFITHHNGFTLIDLYSYDLKHNEDNDEKNHDGKEYNYSWNCGVEGSTKSKKILLLRQKMLRNAFTVLLLSQGTPMLLAGDEFGNSQGGNNNAYCQDNERSWLNWNLIKTNKSIHDYVKRLIEIRMGHPILHRKEEFRVMDYIASGYPDLSFHGTKAWYPDFTPYSRMLGILLCGAYEIIKRDKKSSKPIHTDNYFYFAYNMHWEKHLFDLPKLPRDMEWELLLDTDRETLEIKDKKHYELNPRSITIFISKKLISK